MITLLHRLTLPKLVHRVYHVVSKQTLGVSSRAVCHRVARLKAQRLIEVLERGLRMRSPEAITSSAYASKPPETIPRGVPSCTTDVLESCCGHKIDI